VKSLTVIAALALSSFSMAQLAIRGDTIYTVAGAPIRDGVVLVKDGKIDRVGRAADVSIPDGYRMIRAPVVVPGLIDARATVGLTGMFNDPGHDQDQVDRSAAMQPELRAIDAYNPLEPLVGYLRSFGITTVHTGHSPESLISGGTFIAKTVGNTADEAAIVREWGVSATLGSGGVRSGGSPGNRSKQIAMLRQALLDAKEVKEDERDLRKAMLRQVVRGERPMLINAHKSSDIAAALRLADEFKIRIVLEGASESYLMIDAIKRAGVPVIVHPTMMRARGDGENASFETASILQKAGIPVALQSGFEGYVPKVRVVLFEAAVAAANGMGMEGALRAVTLDAAKILGIDKRVGSIETGKDADIALFSGDPFEYTSQCVGVVIDGKVVSEIKR